MTRCDHCGSECPLPFTCQRCHGKFCPSCRLPPNHNCSGIESWSAKPQPPTGMNYPRGGGMRVPGGVAMESQRRPEKNAGESHPYLKIMAAVAFLVLLGLAWLELNGY